MAATQLNSGLISGFWVTRKQPVELRALMEGDTALVTKGAGCDGSYVLHLHHCGFHFFKLRSYLTSGAFATR